MEERHSGNIQKLKEIIQEEQITTPQNMWMNLMRSMQRHTRAILQNQGGHTKYIYVVDAQGYTHF